MIDSLKSLNAELDEYAALLRSHFPDESDEQLRARAISWHSKRCKDGRWPSSQEIENAAAAIASAENAGAS
jgi:hypothetical protein